MEVGVHEGIFSYSVAHERYRSDIGLAEISVAVQRIRVRKDESYGEKTVSNASRKSVRRFSDRRRTSRAGCRNVPYEETFRSK
ncbi:hypothetical protein TNCV_2192831 [Trichonephila clavipes]|nr:hypothetical protein TNCV_2192831 [Trichonephila clavipes]